MRCSQCSVIATVQLVEFVCLLVRPPGAAYWSLALPLLLGSPPSPQDVLVQAVVSFALWEEKGHQEHLKATQRTIKYVACAIPILTAVTYCLYFMLYKHAFAVWWMIWSYWAALPCINSSTCSYYNIQPFTALSLCIHERILPALTIA